MAFLWDPLRSIFFKDAPQPEDSTSQKVDDDGIFKKVIDVLPAEDNASTRDDNDEFSRLVSMESIEEFVEEDSDNDTSVVLVAPDGKAYYAPHWHSKDGVAFERLQADLAAAIRDDQTCPIVMSGQALEFSPLEGQECQTKHRDHHPLASLPRSPSLKTLSERLFDV